MGQKRKEKEPQAKARSSAQLAASSPGQQTTASGRLLLEPPVFQDWSSGYITFLFWAHHMQQKTNTRQSISHHFPNTGGFCKLARKPQSWRSPGRVETSTSPDRNDCPFQRSLRWYLLGRSLTKCMLAYICWSGSRQPETGHVT